MATAAAKLTFEQFKTRYGHADRAYEFYLVDPSDRSVVQWLDGATTPCAELASIPVGRIWDALDRLSDPPQ